MITEPDLDRDGWMLESAVERHQQDPERFIIPGKEERTHLSGGRMAKLLFLMLGQNHQGLFVQCERMWVTVTEVTASGYVGRLESQPHTSKVLKPGDSVYFQADHVASLL
jgi:uncharacterized protein YegJ (DUF2314 family)